MNQLASSRSSRETVFKLIDLMRHCSGLRIDARVVEHASGADSRTAPELSIAITGEDAPLFLENEAELLKAVHHLTGSALNLEPHDLDRLRFDVDDRLAEPLNPEMEPLAVSDRASDAPEVYAFGSTSAETAPLDTLLLSAAVADVPASIPTVDAVIASPPAHLASASGAACDSEAVSQV